MSGTGLKTLAILIILIATGITPAHGRSKSSQITKHQSVPIETGLGVFKWGDSVDKIRNHFTNMVNQKFSKLMNEAVDVVARDRISKKRVTALTRQVGKYIKFDGRRSGYETSLVGNEFKHKTGEGMIRIRVNKRDYYFFFMAGKFWKLFQIHGADVVDKFSFPAFVAAAEKKYGKARKYKHKVDKIGIHILKGAILDDGRSRLELKEHTKLYSSYTMSFSDNKVQKNIADLRGRAAQTDKEADNTEALLDSIMARPAPIKLAPKAAGKKSKKGKKTKNKNDRKGIVIF